MIGFANIRAAALYWQPATTSLLVESIVNICEASADPTVCHQPRYRSLDLWRGVACLVVNTGND